MFVNTVSNTVSAQALAYSARNYQTPTSNLAAQTTALANSTKVDTASVKQADFTNMTRQEMRDWVNGQIRNGDMSLDDSRSFMAMTMKIPVVGTTSGELLAADDAERIDFTQRVSDGIQGALSRNDQTTVKMLESAVQIMKRLSRWRYRTRTNA